MNRDRRSPFSCFPHIIVLQKDTQAGKQARSVQRMLSTISRLRLNARRPSFRQTLLLATPILVSALYARHPFNVSSTWTHLRGMATQSALSVSDDARDYGSFKLLQSFPIKYAPVKVAKWRSEKTGLTVVVGDHQGGFGLGINRVVDC
jgi:hypothetical protein